MLTAEAGTLHGIIALTNSTGVALHGLDTKSIDGNAISAKWIHGHVAVNAVCER